MSCCLPWPCPLSPGRKPHRCCDRVWAGGRCCFVAAAGLPPYLSQDSHPLPNRFAPLSLPQGGSPAAAAAASGGGGDAALPLAPLAEEGGAAIDPAIAAWWAVQQATAFAAGTAPALPTSFDVTVSPRESVQEAIDRCREGGSVLLLPGAYEGGVVLSKEVHLFGRGEATLQGVAVDEEGGEEEAVITSTALEATLDGLIVRVGPHAEDGVGHHGILITAGSLLVRHCDVSSQSLSSICVQGASADPTILGCKVHGGGDVGIYFDEDSKGRVEGCDIVGNFLEGISIEYSAPLIIANRIHGSAVAGVSISGICDRPARLEGNQIWANLGHGVEIIGDASLLANDVHSNEKAGVFVIGGKGRLERNIIRANGRGGVFVHDRGDPTLLGNIIRDHAGRDGFGVYVHGSAFGNVVWGDGNRFSGNEAGDLLGAGEAMPTGGQPAPAPVAAPTPPTPADAKLLRELECAVCLGTMLRPLTICGSGHSACMACYTRLNPKKCPTCRGALLPRPIRILALEALAQDVLVPCPNVADGCSLAALRYADAGAHADTCDWRKVTRAKLGSARPLSAYLARVPLAVPPPPPLCVK